MPDIESPLSRQRRVFLSYSHADRDVARSIADALPDSGLHIWFAEWELSPGESIAEWVDAGLASSDVLVVLLSPASVASPWVAEELNAGLLREVSDRAIAVIPALIEDCELPPILAGRPYLDLRSEQQSGIRRLVSQLGAASALELSQLTPGAFESLIADLLDSLGYSVQRTNVGPDLGFDMIATAPGTGREKGETWVVQAKFYRERRVSVDTLRQTLASLASSAISHELIVTNSGLTSVAREVLSDWKERKSGPELRVIDGPELTTLLLRQPALVHRYFSRSGGNE